MQIQSFKYHLGHARLPRIGNRLDLLFQFKNAPEVDFCRCSRWNLLWHFCDSIYFHIDIYLGVLPFLKNS